MEGKHNYRQAQDGDASQTARADKHMGKTKVLCVYEAKAMTAQFEYYTKLYHVPLIPLGGACGIDHRYSLAMKIKEIYEDNQ